MKTQTALIVVMLVFSGLSGCSGGDVSFETRRDSDIQFSKQRLLSTKSQVVSRWSKDILSALNSVNSTNILEPRLASAVLAKGTNGTYGLFVFWIENQPSVNSVEFAYQEANSQASHAILDIALEQVQAEAKVGIVFGKEEDWRDKSDMWEHLEQIVSTNNLKVRLLRAKTPVTDWFPVAFFKGDRWISDVVTNK